MSTDVQEVQPLYYTWWIIQQNRYCLAAVLDKDRVVYGLIKEILYEYAWNSDEHKALTQILRKFSEAPYSNAIAKDAYAAINQGRKQLEIFLEQKEVLKGDRISVDDDYSDDSDDEEVSARQILGADLAGFYLSGVLTAAEEDLAAFFSNSNHKLTMGSDPAIFRTAVQAGYEDHLKRQGWDRVKILESITPQVQGGFRIKAMGHNKKPLEEFDTAHEPRVLLFRGIGHFADRWHGAARRVHRRTNSEIQLYSEAALRSHFNPAQEYQKLAAISEGERRKVEAELEEVAGHLLDNLKLLRHSPPVIEKKNSQYRIFNDLLGYLQFVYTNGIDRFQDLIQGLQDSGTLKKILSAKGNPYVSFSELPIHALRYAQGLKEPYSEFVLPPRRNQKGRPEKPYTGKLYITSHPIEDFVGAGKPYIIREMYRLGEVTTRWDIGPELEVSFLGRVPAGRSFHTERVRVPSFHKDDYPEHYFNKYGINFRLYKCVQDIYKKYGSMSRECQRVEAYLKQYLSLYHSVRLFLFLLKEAENQGQVVLFLSAVGKLTTVWPQWDSSANTSQSLSKNSENIIKRHADNKVRFFSDPNIYGGLELYWLPPQNKSKKIRKHLSPKQKYFSEGASSSGLTKFKKFGDLKKKSFLFEASTSSRLAPEVGPFPIADTAVTILPDNTNAWEIDVDSDGDCLFYAVILTYLLPTISDSLSGTSEPDEYIMKLSRLFGSEFLEQTNKITHAFSDYQRTEDWYKSHLKWFVQVLRNRIATEIDNLDEPALEAIRQDRDGKSDAELKSIFSTPGMFSGVGEMIALSHLLQIHIAYHVDGSGWLFVNKENGSIHSVMDLPPGEDVLFLKFVPVSPGQPVRHWHAVIPQNQLDGGPLASIFGPHALGEVALLEEEANEEELEEDGLGESPSPG